jgi:hypothetical protein
MGNKRGNKLFMDFLKQCGFDSTTADDMLTESAAVSLELCEEMGDRPDINAMKVIIGLCILNLGVDGVLTDWGWQDPDEMEPTLVNEKLRNRLSSYVFNRHLKAIRNRYAELKFGGPQSEKAND